MTEIRTESPPTSPPVPALPAELRCPLCEYDLRGLIDPRCPECGYRFTWDEIRDPARRLHPYLFEHHPERNRWSFVRTLLGGLRPRRFWRQLTPQTPSNPRRLVRYWLLTLAMVLPACAAALLVTGRELHANNARARGFITKHYLAPANAAKLAELQRTTGLSLEQYLQRHVVLFPSPRFFLAMIDEPFPRFIWPTFVAVALWPWVTVVMTRMLLWISIRRAKLRMVHLARCAIHAADVGGWYWLMATGAMAFVGFAAMRGKLPFVPGVGGFSFGHEMVIVLAWGLLAALAVAWYRLAVAFAKYLRLPHAVAVVVLTQLLVLFVVFALTQAVIGIVREISQHLR